METFIVTSLVGAEATTEVKKVCLKAQTQWSKEYLDPAKTKALFRDVKEMKITSKAANLKNLTLNDSENLVVNQPMIKKSGEVPRTKANIVKAPDQGLPVETAKTSMA